MHLTRRTGLMLAAALMGSALMPVFAAHAQGGVHACFRDVEAGQIVVHPVDHALIVVDTPGGVICVDPVGDAGAYAGLPAVPVIANPAVAGMLPAEMAARTTIMANGDMAEALGIPIEAGPACNITPDRLQNHPKGRDNGSVRTIGGRRFLIAGDTEDMPELRALCDIPVAFLPMNLPYTMSVDQAANAVAAFAALVQADWYPGGA